jgi:V/A-type H+-transporting ATPase subunit D
MATNVNPTRMELTRLKRRLATAVRGHKLLKDKRDEMVRQFMIYIRRNHELRLKMEKALQNVSHHFVVARAHMGFLTMNEALLYPARSAEFEVGSKNVMSVDVPTLTYTGATADDAAQVPYSFAFTTGELDTAVTELTTCLPDLLELAEVEKTCNMLADEIEKPRRRVNALEYVMIPEMQESIKYITMKLSENERASTVRLMKAKEIMAKQA